MTDNETWDDVIVGAGSAGCVLASRLSEDPGRRVLLLEAGPDQTDEPRQQAVGTSVLSGANWDYTASIDGRAEGGQAEGGRVYPYCVGKVTGGSSAVNGAIALRGLPVDFDSWAEAGNPRWAWRHVVPYFAKLESDADYGGGTHGNSGPVPIRRMVEKDFNILGTAFHDACLGLGLPRTPDLNASTGLGVGPVPVNWEGGYRMSTAATYLAAARGRAGLTVRAMSHVTRVLFNGDQAVGVEVLRDGSLQRVPARRVTLCAGAVSTPAILLRSGIGDAGQLAALGIDPVADLPGVGGNLSEHAVVAAWAMPRSGICVEGDPWHTVIARATSGNAELDPAGAPAFTLSMLNNVPTANVPFIGAMMGGKLGVTFAVMLLSPESRGSVSLSGTAPEGKPVISLNLLSSQADLERMMTGTRMLWSVIRTPAVAELLERVLFWTDPMVSDDAKLASAVRRMVAPQWHASGTAKMGPAADGTAVVDECFRVHGVSNLRVVDASAMPVIPRSTMNLTCMMMAERAAAWMA